MSNLNEIKEVNLQEDLNIDNKRLRFSDAPWASEIQFVSVGGAGGIGSWLILYLTRIGHEVGLFEMDTVDETNLAGQLYGDSSIGKTKHDAIQEIVSLLVGDKHIMKLGTLGENNDVSQICFSCFDNMKARSIMFSKWKEQEDRIIFIDARMTVESLQIFAVTPGREKDYEEELFDDDEIEDAPCTNKATSHCGSIAAALQVSVFNNFLYNRKKNKKLGSVPFKCRFDLPVMDFVKTK